MAKSLIIKELANGTVDTITALKRTKVLLSNLDNKEIISWINHEISGYPNDVKLPSYRTTQGSLVGSYFKGSMVNHIKYNNVPLPLGNMPDDIKEKLLCIEFREGVESLEKLLIKSQNNEIAKVVPADFYPAIAKYNNDMYMIISSAKVVFENEFIRNVISSVENKLLDILILLEKEYGSLDDLDIDTSKATDEELNSITQEIYVIIYNDNSISIGNDNKINHTDITTSKN